MIRTTLLAGAFALAMTPIVPASAQDADMDTFEWGDDSSIWANDGECDDPRFDGPGASGVMLDEDLKSDATDCRALFEDGEVTLASEINISQTNIVFDDIDFGDDTSDYASDGECDDPRFEGPGAASVLLDDDRGRDATDCQMLYEIGEIALEGEYSYPEAMERVDGIQFGFDTSDWANDNECDDPRFSGSTMASGPLDPYDAYADASDCLAGYQSDDLTYNPDWRFATPPTAAEIDAVDFGNDSGDWTFDGECDDPRFEGQGAAFSMDDEDVMADASDCRALFMEGWVTLKAD